MKLEEAMKYLEQGGVIKSKYSDKKFKLLPHFHTGRPAICTTNKEGFWIYADWLTEAEIMHGFEIFNESEDK